MTVIRTYRNAANVSTASFKDAMIPLPGQAEGGREIVGENDENKPTACGQSRGLEDLIALRDDNRGAVSRSSRLLILESFSTMYWMK